MALLEQCRGRLLGDRNPPPDPGLVGGWQKWRRRCRRLMARLDIMEEGEVANIFLGWYAMGWWGRVSTEVVLVAKRIFGGKINDM